MRLLQEVGHHRRPQHVAAQDQHGFLITQIEALPDLRRVFLAAAEDEAEARPPPAAITEGGLDLIAVSRNHDDQVANPGANQVLDPMHQDLLAHHRQQGQGQVLGERGQFGALAIGKDKCSHAECSPNASSPGWEEAPLV